jgi:hypothetical protein
MKQAITSFGQIRQAILNLNPAAVRQAAAQPLRIRIAAATPGSYRRIESFLCPPGLSPQRRAAAARLLETGNEPADLEIWDEELLRPRRAFPFVADRPLETVGLILDARPDLKLPLARHFPPFRAAVVRRLIHEVSRENALFSMATALPDLLPGLLTLPWAVGQFASDTAFLTMNQTRMAFLLAAANDHPVGYSEQRAEVGAIIAGAFGWRAVARQAAGKIPLGGGLIPKAAVAYAGTFVAGQYLDALYRQGYKLSRGERKSAYGEALNRGREVAAELLEQLRRRRTA